MTMYKALSPGAIGVRPRNLEDAIAAAQLGGFAGVEFNASEVADRIESEGLEAVKDRFSRAGVRPAGWGIGFDWRSDEQSWRDGLAKLPRLAKAAAAIGATATTTWLL